MAKDTTAVVSGSKPSLIARIKEFYQEVMAEMSKVTWPTKDELKSQTSVVLLLLAAMSTIIYLYDAIFQLLMVVVFKLTTKV